MESISMSDEYIEALNHPIWGNTCKAIDAVLESAAAALEVFNDLDFIEPALKSFVDEVIPYIEDLKEQVEECIEDDDGDETVALMEQLLDDAEFADELFSCIEFIPSDVLNLLGYEVSDEVSNSFNFFIETRLEPVRKALGHLYDVMLRAA